ncbi:hypothetical protein BCY86_04355 [Pajaroellobacter abortibovis]|uniref:Uncharacterized protein n=1 Tax=Pajaroellobacter abortibovis TaxID=1882918 RepID=A0A1L6MWV6_9BACT|nr:hypothetical protein BCY86_04355 [Pajaroellobacter abortibovis]
MLDSPPPLRRLKRLVPFDPFLKSALVGLHSSALPLRSLFSSEDKKKRKKKIHFFLISIKK